jgi:hypothetical protein
MARRCPYCGAQRDYKYYLVKIISSVSFTYACFQILDYELHLVELIKYLLSRSP